MAIQLGKLMVPRVPPTTNQSGLVHASSQYFPVSVSAAISLAAHRPRRSLEHPTYSIQAYLSTLIYPHHYPAFLAPIHGPTNRSLHARSPRLYSSISVSVGGGDLSKQHKLPSITGKRRPVVVRNSPERASICKGVSILVALRE